MGKLASKELRNLLKFIERNPKIIVSPAPGNDSGVHLLDENICLVVSTDPCIGVPEKWFGWLLINYAASDVALFGAKPEYCAIVLLGTPSTKSETLIEIMKQACAAAAELNMTVVTGHTGKYEGLSTVVGTCTAYGIISKEKLIIPGGAQPDDCILLTKRFGLETVANFTQTHKDLAESLFGFSRSRELQNSIGLQTCVKEATFLANVTGVHAMHDTTEGGLVAALNEMAESSKLGFVLDSYKIPILKEARILQKHFNLSQNELLSTSSTGNLLVAVDSISKSVALKELRRHGIEACAIGTFTKEKKRLLSDGEKKRIFPMVAEDPYTKIMGRS